MAQGKNDDDSIRALLSTAIDDAEAGDDKNTGDGANVEDEGVDGAAGAGGAEGADGNSTEGAGDEAGDDGEGEGKDGKPKPKDGEAKEGDEPSGEKKVGEKQVAKKKVGSVEDEDGVKQTVQLPKSRAPGSWKPSAREKWAGMAPEVQQEVLRREREISNGFNEIATVKKFHQDYGSIMTQHQAIINAEGGDGMKMTRDLYQTAATLYNGTPVAKAQTIAAFIRNFGIDLPMLDGILAGDPPKQGQQGGGQQGGNQDAGAYIRNIIQAELAPLLGQRTKQDEAEVGQSLEEFASDPKNEFFEDLREDMADILEMGAKRGKKISLQDAYSRASMLNTEIAGVIKERELQKKVASGNSAAAKARKRAVSVHNTPSKELASGDESKAAPNSLRDDLLSAVESLED